MIAQAYCAVVHSIGNAHSHIAEKSAHCPAQSKERPTLKALARKVLQCTLPRTLPAQCKKEPRTLPAHYTRTLCEPRTMQRLQSPGRLRAPGKPSPVALAWIREHRQALQCNGWTMAELYRRNKSRGIAWCGLWEKPFLKVFLQPGGVIEFECIVLGRDIIQTARSLKNNRSDA